MGDILASTDQPASEAESISVIYDGGLASTGQLHFYEYGRAAYAFARVVATIENFRRRGTVAKRISSDSYVNIFIQAPEKGSFPLDILVPFVAVAASEIYKIPVKIFVEYIIHQIRRILPKDEDKMFQLSKIWLETEQKRSSDETERMREVRKIVEDGNITTRAMIGVLEDALKRGFHEETGISRDDTARLINELNESEARENRLAPYQHQLSNIDQDDLARLTSRVRPQLAEAGLPLRVSAKSMTLTAGTGRVPIASFDSDSISDIKVRKLDDKSSVVTLRLTAYDRDMGAGKCDVLDKNLRRMHFTVPINVRTEIRPKILDGMNKDAVTASVRFFTDASKIITSLQLYDIIEPEEL